ncbi:zinc finger protein OZF-like [Toxorhynchites rutilus septentrionalis]|uniref:zinc finger protein OZF-like n=1 Tax=Toxorhynchites rutilus septentrionalis TaxID=329112 RepID=UPI00247833D6|nr:zinc finger protein OZF-like [Toxorhynchites rutilus septentrionalis]
MMNQAPICRTCHSQTNSKCRMLFKESLICGQKQKFVDILKQFIPTLEIHDDEKQPQVICSKCSLTLKHFVRFRLRCLQVDSQWRTKVGQIVTIDQDTKAVPDGAGVGGNNYNDVLENEATHQKNRTYISSEFIPNEGNAVRERNTELRTNETDAPNVGSSGTNQSKSCFECQYCHKILSTKKSYQCHLLLHSEDTNFLCNCCGEHFKTRMAYVGHMATHDPEKYRCDICGKSYRQAASLRTHLLGHSKEKPFACTICGHSTTQKSGLKRHMLTHSDSKPYVCDLCGEHFRFSSNLIMHKRRKHWAEKAFECESCPKRFVSKDELLNHSMCHTNDRPFQCDLCVKTFNRKSSLQFHRKHKHSLQADIACHICGRGFAQKVSLQNHLRNHILMD